jgi:hypothetical protein
MPATLVTKTKSKKVEVTSTGMLFIPIECSLRRLIRLPEHLIGRHWYLPAN